jgi:hypothetical protein
MWFHVIERSVFSIVVSRNWKIHQLDIHNAFLNGVLIEEVYMKQTPGFVDFAFLSHVCRLHKSLYGLKQAPRAWYTRLSDFLLSIGFHASKVDTSLFILSVDANIFYLLVYVDDILFIDSNSTMLHRLIYLYLRMQMKPYLLGQGVYSFVDGSLSCPPSHIISSSSVVHVPNPAFMSWKQQDHLIISIVLSSLSTELLHLVVDCHSSSSISWASSWISIKFLYYTSPWIFARHKTWWLHGHCLFTKGQISIWWTCGC